MRAPEQPTCEIGSDGSQSMQLAAPIPNSHSISLWVHTFGAASSHLLDDPVGPISDGLQLANRGEGVLKGGAYLGGSVGGRMMD